MDAILRLLGRRARSEDSKEAWEAYASALERLFGTPEPFKNLSEEIDFLDEYIHQTVLGFAASSQQVLWPESQPSLYYVSVTSTSANNFLKGWIILPDASADSYEDSSSLAVEVLRRYGAQYLKLSEDFQEGLPNIGHWSYVNHLRDSYGWVIGEFEVELG